MTKKSLTMIFISLGVLTACDKSSQKPSKVVKFVKAKPAKPDKRPIKLVPIPKPLPLPGQLKPKPKAKKTKSTSRPIPLPPRKAIKEAKEKALHKPNGTTYINAIKVYPYTKGALYQVYTSVNQVTDIALQPGERLKSVSAGDTARWIVGNTTSGYGDKEQSHILVKPTQSNLKTNLVINTNLRTYHLELLSDPETYMSSVSWNYPKDELIALKTRLSAETKKYQNTVTPQFDLKNLNFRYNIKGDAPWRPIQVFDDGAKVYIRFPSNVQDTQAPPLFVLDQKGDTALINYRVKAPYYIVDRLFVQAELRLGQKKQDVVTITRVSR